jgi:formate dehydrogenase subunit gamma
MSKTPGRVERYGFSERLMHSAAALSYVYLLATGLAFWTPALYWLAVVLGGGYLSRQLHPWVGVVFTAVVVWMWVAWRRDMRVSDDDRRWRSSMASYITNDDAKVPPAGRFNYGQKMLFWVMAGGAVGLMLSGLVMWFVASVPANLLWLRALATIVHAVSALLTAGGFIVHLYMGLAVVPGGLDAILHGYVSEEWAKHHHPLWRPSEPRTRK